MTEISPRAKRHLDYVQVAPLLTPRPANGGSSLRAFAEAHLETDLSEPEPDGYTRITKEKAEELLVEMDSYVATWGPLVEADATLESELRAVLDSWG